MNAVAQLVPGLFSDAEMVLIRRIHGVLPPAQLLDLLNARRVADRGAHAPALTLEQLLRTLATLAKPAPDTGWSGLRKLVEAARASGVLAQINAQVIDDFAVVFSLNARQVVTLKDILLATDGDDE
ncbi:hypothetical protein ABEG10_38160 (plasmid) [Burkholderia cenocepacia]|uniref:hypothetical protein n=1 Tax=Burkholderia cenocepacia TaxID=95486 RepID=UPI0020A1E79E|nr:hypothetical protein [Burkholderia cenocepacia]MCO8402788.1 hypothetical protein [Burkholderia cenocepacia]MCO8415027.1 hypothetical protein [Burkholderia cenocepacia]MCO8423077.1 hypothetical protein [Burkholderia cenocepacia]MCO8474774.1 hypothetical protein [Burkholderia cenocepacia]MCO8482046.1 hypothetical protein [Burkholderia cenocepacia]